MPILLLIIVYMCLQLYIYLLIKKHNQEILDRVFEGVFHKNDREHLWRTSLFYLNPFGWKEIKEFYIKFLLYVNIEPGPGL